MTPIAQQLHRVAYVKVYDAKLCVIVGLTVDTHMINNLLLYTSSFLYTWCLKTCMRDSSHVHQVQLILNHFKTYLTSNTLLPQKL